jgi:hypothetical protein
MPHCFHLKAIRPEQPTSVPPFLLFLIVVLRFTFVAWLGFTRFLLSNCFRCSLFKAVRPERFHDKVRACPDVPPSCRFPLRSNLCGAPRRSDVALYHDVRFLVQGCGARLAHSQALQNLLYQTRLEVVGPGYYVPPEVLRRGRRRMAPSLVFYNLFISFLWILGSWC